MNGNSEKSYREELEMNQKYNSSEDIVKSKENEKNKKQISIQIFSKTSSESKEERYTIDSDKPLTKKEITQIVIEKTGNNSNISEIKVKYNNSADGDISIKFDNIKSSKTIDSNIESTLSIIEKPQMNKYKDKTNKNDRYNEDNINDEYRYTSRSFKSSLELKSEKPLKQDKIKYDKLDKNINYFDQPKFITKENGASKEKSKKSKKSKLKFLDDTSPQKTNRSITNKKYKSQNSNVTAGAVPNGIDDKGKQRYDNFGNVIAKNSNHKVCFADSIRKKLIDVVDIQSHKDYIANMNKQDFGKKDSVKCKCCSCTIF